MHRFMVAVFLLLSAICSFAQVAQPTPLSDPLAVSLAQKAVAALTGGVPVSDVTLNANVISIAGSDNETGTGTLEAKGIVASRVDLNLNGGPRTDVRNAANGVPAGAWEKNVGASTPDAQHNCWTDAAWFFPALSSLAQTASPNFVFKYIGQEQHGGVTVQHIRAFQILPGDTSSLQLSQHLSAMDFYLDPASYLPLAVAFQIHADDDMSTDISTEIRFANYQTVKGLQVPFHFQRLLSGGVVLDVTVTNAAVNTGLLDSSFTLP